MVSTVAGQCEFPTLDKYGLICEEARFLCGYEMDGYVGKLLDEKSPLPQPDPLCAGAGEADNIQWFSFVTDDVNLEIIIRYSDCTGNILSPGLQVGIFESCELDSDMTPLGSIYCVEDINYSDIILTPDSADIEVGQLYLLFVDGYAGSACDFEIEVISGVCTDPPPSPEECEQDCGIIYSNVDHESCTFFQDTFMLDPGVQLNGGSSLCGGSPENIKLDSIMCVEWVIEPDTGFTIISESFEYFDSLGVVPTLIVEWAIEQDYLIKPIIHLNPLYSGCGNGCICTDDVAFSISISESMVVLLDEVEYCPGECVDFCDTTYCNPGVYQCFNRDECLIEILTIVEVPITEIDQGTHFICGSQCFEFQGQTYCDEDAYSVVDTASCDTMHQFQLLDLDFSIELIQSEDLLTCTISEAEMEGAWNTNFNGNIISAWISELGDTVSFGPAYTATTGGNYTFIAWPEGMQECATSLVHTVTADDAIPVATLQTPFLDCNNSSDDIIINSQNNIVSASWIGPNGYTSNDINPKVTEGGNYEVVMTASNGCTLILNTEVLSDFEIPNVQLDYDNWTCSEEIPSSSFSTSSTIESHEWTLPGGSTSGADILNLDDLGAYSLEVTGTNGCVNQINFDVADLSYDPSLQLSEDKIWRCNDTAFSLDLDAQQVAGLSYLWTTLEGGLLSNTINVTISEPGIYILTVEDEEVSCIGYDTVRIKEDPNPFVDMELESFAPMCEDDSDGSIGIINIEGGEGPYRYEINGSSYSDLADVFLSAGTYTLDIFDGFDCQVSKIIDIPEAQEFTVMIDSELDIRFGESKTLFFESNLTDNDIISIEWSDDKGQLLGIDRELLFTGSETEYIYLNVVNLEGCTAEAQIKVNLSFEVDIFYPNVFSPNNDGNNDVFSLFNNGYPDLMDQLKVFDRSGELVYSSAQTQFNDSNSGWDGTFNGSECQPGVYVFIIEYTLMNGEHKTMSGTITLVR